MLQALLRGKLSREQENLEDILTSNVFGALGYLDPKDGPLPFLALAETASGDRDFAWISELAPSVKVSATYEFWPWWEKPGCYGGA